MNIQLIYNFIKQCTFSQTMKNYTLYYHQSLLTDVVSMLSSDLEVVAVVSTSSCMSRLM